MLVHTAYCYTMDTYSFELSSTSGYLFSSIYCC